MTGFKPGDRVFHRGLLRNGTVTTSAGPLTIVAWDDGSQTTAVSTDYLEPLGEPMSTKFQSTIHDNLSLQVGRLTHEEVSVGIHDGHKLLKGLTLGASDAPALALAILEAAGVEPLSEHCGANNDPSAALSHASHFLAKHAELTQAAAKEAADREALEGEALELFNALREANDNNLVDGFHDIPAGYQETWLAVAKTSRHLHGVTA